MTRIVVSERAFATECKRALEDWKRALLVAAKYNHGYETVDPSCRACVPLPVPSEYRVVTWEGNDAN